MNFDPCFEDMYYKVLSCPTVRWQMTASWNRCLFLLLLDSILFFYVPKTLKLLDVVTWYLVWYARVDNRKLGTLIYTIFSVEFASFCVEKNKMNVGLWNTVFPLRPWRAQYLSLLFPSMLGMLLLIEVVLYIWRPSVVVRMAVLRSKGFHLSHALLP